MTRNRLTRATLILVAIGLLATTVVTAHDALADRNIRGIDYLEFDAEPIVCGSEDALPCLPGGGHGKSNTVYVRQTDVDGEHRFTDVFGTAIDSEDVWFQTAIEGKCGRRFRLRDLHIDLHHVGNHVGRELEASQDDIEGFPIRERANSGNRTLPRRQVAVSVPVDLVFDRLVPVIDPVEWGERMVEDRMAEGMSETEARRAPHTTSTAVGLNTTLSCRKHAIIKPSDPFSTVSTWHPLEIVWLGTGMEPGDEDSDEWRDGALPPDPVDPTPEDPSLSLGFQVTQAHLSVLPDPADECLLHLSGAVTTTQPGVVRYRFVDELDRRSQPFAVEVDHTLTAMVDHEVRLDPVVLDPPPAVGPADAFTAEGDDGTDGDGIGGFAHEKGDNVQGFYRLEVFDPHTKLSAIASYNVDGCVTEGPGATGSDDVTLPTLPPAPPEPPPTTIPGPTDLTL
jgi:hypothetical protein